MSTKKMRILIISLVALLIIAIGAYIAVDTAKTREEQAAIDEAKSLQLFSFDENSIDKVEIQNADGHFIIDNASGSWSVTDTDYPYEFTLNTYYINSICTYLSDLTALKKLETADLSGYGLTDPAVLTCYQGDTAYTLYIGNASATEEYYYVMTPDNSFVYGIEFNEGEVLRGGLNYLKDPYMLNYFDVNINYVKLEHDHKISFEINKDTDGWHMSNPLPNADVNAANINSMLTSITRLELESFVKMAETPDDLYQYHLDKPAYCLTVKTDTGEITTINFAEFDPNDGSVYLAYQENGQIATMTTNSVIFLQTNASELISDKLFPVDFTDVSKLEVTVDDLHFSMIMNHEENQYTFQNDDLSAEISAQDAELSAMFQSLFTSVSNMNFDSLDLETEPSDNESAVIFRYTFTDGTETELSMIPIDDTYYWTFVDGEYTGKIVRRRVFSSASGVLTYYDKMLMLLEMNS